MLGLFATLSFFAILTLWIPGYWPVTVFQVGIFALTAVVAWRARHAPPAFSWPLVPLSFGVLWGLFQLFTAHTAYTVDTRLAVLRWATFLCVFAIGICVFHDEGSRAWFRSAMLWFAFLTAVLATIQTFTSGGEVFWLFPTEYTDYVMGPILNRNHYAAFIEAVLPIALYRAVRREHDSLLYSGMAAAMYASVIASASRAGTVLATLEVVLVPLLLSMQGRTGGRNVSVTLFRMGAISTIFIAVVGWNTVWARFWMNDPMMVRREFGLSTLQMAKSHPWLGMGLGTWPTVYPQFAIIDVGLEANQAHNDWLQWTAEGGVSFGVMMASLFVWTCRPAVRSVWGLGAIAVFLHALVDYPFSRPGLGCWTIIILALLAFPREDSANSESP